MHEEPRVTPESLAIILVVLWFVFFLLIWSAERHPVLEILALMMLIPVTITIIALKLFLRRLRRYQRGRL